MNDEQLARIETALAGGMVGAESITELIELISLLSNWGVSVSDVVKAIQTRYFLSWHSAMMEAEEKQLPVLNFRYGKIYPE